MGNGEADAVSFQSISARSDADGAIDLNSDTEDPCDPSHEVAAKFTEHTILRIVGLLSAPALNGKSARVQNFVEERNRYNISLLDGKGETLKLVQPENLEALTLKEEVEELLKELCLSGVQVEVATQVILRLRVLPIDLALLKETKIGKVLNDLTKPGGRLANNDIFANLGRNLVRRWRDRFSEAQGKKRDREDSARQDATEGASSASSSAVRVFAPRAMAPPIVSGQALHLVAVPGREDSPGVGFVTADIRRCQARIWNDGNGGQCSRARALPGELCGVHQSLLERDGSLPHGRMDGVIPSSKQVEYKNAQLENSIDHLRAGGSTSRSNPLRRGSARSGLGGRLHSMRHGAADLQAIPPITSDLQAQKMVEGMRNAPTDRMRLSMLMAVDCTHPSFLPAFVTCGGVHILEKWTRDHSECCFACLVLLQQLPLGKSSHYTSLINTLKGLLQKDILPETKSQARAVLDMLTDAPHAQAPTKAVLPRVATETATGSTATAKEKAKPPLKRPFPGQVESLVKHPKASPPQRPPAVAATGSMASASATATQATPQATSVAPAVPLLPASGGGSSPASGGGSSPSGGAQKSAVVQVPVLPADCPEEMHQLDPRIRAVLCQNPKLIKLLKKHPAYFQNFNKDSIARLGSLLRRSRDSEMEDSKVLVNVEDEVSRTITISNLPSDTTESDVEALFDDIGKVQVTMPVESRKRRHVGIAFALVVNPQLAERAAVALNGSKFRAATDPSATITTISAVVQRHDCPPQAEEDPAPPVSWKTTDELWEVRMYNKEESVKEGCQLDLPLGMLPCLSAEARSQFQEAARREREEQARMVNAAELPQL